MGAQLRGGVLADNPGDGDPGVADPGVRDPGDGRPVSYCLYLLLFERCQAELTSTYLAYLALSRVSLLIFGGCQAKLTSLIPEMTFPGK